MRLRRGSRSVGRMADTFSRRAFLGATPALALLGVQSPSALPAPATFPVHEPDVVREVVLVAHGNLARLKELVSVRPALARVSWDWGFGDWETPIDAASHVGNRPIAEFLLANGARPTIFTAAMMGQLATVKAFIDGVPGVQRNRGPHGLTLLHHARVGAAAEVTKYLETLGDADPHYPSEPLSDTDRQAIVGEYVFGAGSVDRLRVALDARGALTIQKPGSFERYLFHHGGLVFNPTGAEAVRIRFDVVDARARGLRVEDGPVTVVAPRAPAS